MDFHGGAAFGPLGAEIGGPLGKIGEKIGAKIGGIVSKNFIDDIFNQVTAEVAAEQTGRAFGFGFVNMFASAAGGRTTIFFEANASPAPIFGKVVDHVKIPDGTDDGAVPTSCKGCHPE